MQEFTRTSVLKDEIATKAYHLEDESMKSNLTIADWAGIAGIVVVVLLAVQSRTNECLDRIEDRVSEVRIELYSLGQRVARIEALIERPSPLAAGKHGVSETK